MFDQINADAQKYAVLEDDRRVSAKVIAERLGLKLNTVYKLAQRGHVPSYKICSRRRFKLSEVEEALKNR
ncbi:MAG: helix-turn-helix domain-containing protein [Geobacter sp.]|nr:helix-turn-helix domain-containing protein [Geobacter sp.]